MYLFTPDTKLFYPLELLEDYKGISFDGAVKVTERVFIKFRPDNAPKGKILGADRKGNPCWIDAPQQTAEELKQWAVGEKLRLVKHVEDLIAPLEKAVRLGMATDDEVAMLLAWERYSVLLSRIDPQQGSAIEWPEKPS